MIFCVLGFSRMYLELPKMDPGAQEQVLPLNLLKPSWWGCGEVSSWFEITSMWKLEGSRDPDGWKCILELR